MEVQYKSFHSTFLKKALENFYPNIIRVVDLDFLKVYMDIRHMAALSKHNT